MPPHTLIWCAHASPKAGECFSTCIWKLHMAEGPAMCNYLESPFQLGSFSPLGSGPEESLLMSLCFLLSKEEAKMAIFKEDFVNLGEYGFCVKLEWPLGMHGSRTPCDQPSFSPPTAAPWLLYTSAAASSVPHARRSGVLSPVFSLWLLTLLINGFFLYFFKTGDLSVCPSTKTI